MELVQQLGPPSKRQLQPVANLTKTQFFVFRNNRKSPIISTTMKEYAFQRVTTGDALRLAQKDFGVNAIEWLELNSEIINPKFIEDIFNFNLESLNV